MAYQTKKVDDHIERLLLTGLIVSGEFLQGLQSIYKPEFVAVPYIRTVAGWCWKYYEEYHNAPGRHIEDIFNAERRAALDEAQAELIEIFLADISIEFERSDKLNVPYLLDQVEKRFKSRHIQMMNEDLSALLMKGDVDAAETLLTSIKPIERPTSSGIDPFLNVEAIQKAFEQVEAGALFVLPGALGKFLGNIERDTFVSILAPEKRGKCLVGDTLILLPNGEYKRLDMFIRDKNPEVITLNEATGKFEIGKVSDHWINGKKLCVTLRTCSSLNSAGRYITTTTNHLYLTPSGWREVSTIKIGDYIAAVPYGSLSSRIAGRGFIWDKVASIEYVGIQETYDLTVSGNHNFVANDIVAHNSFWMIEFAMRALRQRCNVAFFSVGDMSEAQMIRRLHQYLSKRSIKVDGTIKVPVLDCAKNQDDSCDKIERTCDHGIIGHTKTGPQLKELEDCPNYKPCSVCQKAHGGSFIGAVWYAVLENKKLDWREAVEFGEKFMKTTRGKRFKLATYPNNSVNIGGIRNHLDMWEKEGFIADVVIIDYADILAPEESAKRMDFRHQINESWKAMRALSQERHIFLLTATQADASSYETKQLRESNFSEDKRKFSHISMMITLNQTADEKKQNIMRVGKMFVREDDFDSRASVTVLEAKQIGRPYIASY